jgi:hypothetical protein
MNIVNCQPSVRHSYELHLVNQGGPTFSSSEDYHLHTRRRENLKSQKTMYAHSTAEHPRFRIPVKIVSLDFHVTIYLHFMFLPHATACRKQLSRRGAEYPLVLKQAIAGFIATPLRIMQTKYLPQQRFHPCVYTAWTTSSIACPCLSIIPYCVSRRESLNLIT